MIKTDVSLNVELQQGTMYEDFNTLKQSMYIITSNSTFAYTSLFLNTVFKKAWICNTRYIPHQSFDAINENCEVCEVKRKDINSY